MKKTVIKRIDDGRYISAYIPPEKFKAIREICDKHNPIETLAPVKYRYRARDFYSFIFGLGVESLINMTPEELEERGLI